MSARAMIEKAESYLGYREGAANRNRFSTELGRPAEPWCADFVSAVARESGNGSVFPDTASCSVARNWFDQRGRLSVYPAIGAQVLFGAPGNPYGPGGEHTGICISYDADTLTVIAGNTNDDGSPQGDGVYRRVYQRRSDYVDSYGYPAYPEGLVCADPAWRGRPGVTYFGQEASIDDLPAAGLTIPGQGRPVIVDGLAYGPGASGPHLVAMRAMLAAAGCGRPGAADLGTDWTEADTDSFRRFQLQLGDTGPAADGIPAPRQLHHLERDFGARPYTVQPGDTLTTLAAEFNTTPELLAEANNLTPTTPLTPGQLLHIQR
ncbi:LysM peptidoglycan-binding domain-containing protein [Kitasatospora sp. NPDC002227]|uniref:LysM peptidoglycan-binding domain-containing protein n=1 Tax=Kitasatospora sp. NPDC002227 TaxID=3154773 RepID=UPI0033209ACB